MADAGQTPPNIDEILKKAQEMQKSMQAHTNPKN